MPLALAALAGVGVAGYGAAALAQYDYGDPSSTETTTAPAQTTTTTTTGTGAGSKAKSYRATLTVRAEVPRPSAPAGAAGSLSATVSVQDGRRTLRWTLTYRKLSGRALAAHVHRGKPGVAGAVLVPLCGPCRSGQTGRVAITSSAADALERGTAYVNVHTARNQAGEIRGQVRAAAG